MVIHSLCPHSVEGLIWERGDIVPKGAKPSHLITYGHSFHMYVRPSIHPSNGQHGGEGGGVYTDKHMGGWMDGMNIHVMR
jgi:hypothetical protein